MVSSASSSSPSACQTPGLKKGGEKDKKSGVVPRGERMKESSERSTRSSVEKYDKERSKDDSTQKTVMSPGSMAESDKDVEMEDCRSPGQQTVKDKVRIISVVHQMDDKTGEREEAIEFMLKDHASSADDYSLSPLPYEQEDPTTLMELPDDILHMPISACGPHDE